MRVFATLLLAILLSVPAVLSNDQATLCQPGLDANVHLDGKTVPEPALAQLLPDHELLVTSDMSRLPVIPEFWAAGPSGVCALADLPELLAFSGKQLQTQADFEAAAWLLAQATDPEVLGEQLLGHAKSYEKTPAGVHIELLTKSPATGTLLQWDVVLDRDGSGDATWTVLGYEKGLRTEIEGWFLDVGQTGPLAPGGPPAYPDAKFYPTHDGKLIKIIYDETDYPNVAEADEDVDRNGHGAVFAYDTMNRDWGYPSIDNDGIMEITMDGCACIYRSASVDIHMPRNLQQWIFDVIGSWYPDEDGVVWDVVGHEYFHHFQYSTMGWNQGSWLIEGMARFAETALTPQFSHTPDALQFFTNANGFGYVMLNPGLSPTSHSYSFGLAWGHIYDTNGGVEILKQILLESAVNSAYPGFIDRALAAAPGGHDSFNDAMSDFGLRMVNRDFVWDNWDGSESYDWAAYLAPLRTAKLSWPSLLSSAPGGQVTTSAGSYANAFITMDSDPSIAGPTALRLEHHANDQPAFISRDESGQQTVMPFSDVLVVPFSSEGLVMVYRPPGAGGLIKGTGVGL